MSNRFPVSMAGRIASDPEMRFTSSGQAVARFRLAVEDRQQNGRGNWETVQTIFHTVTAWGRLAENTVDQLRKGDPIVVAGDLRFRTYKTPEGDRRTATEVNATTLGPDLRLSTVSVDRTGRNSRAAEAGREAPAAADDQTADRARDDQRGADTSRATPSPAAEQPAADGDPPARTGNAQQAHTDPPAEETKRSGRRTAAKTTASKAAQARQTPAPARAATRGR